MKKQIRVAYLLSFEQLIAIFLVQNVFIEFSAFSQNRLAVYFFSESASSVTSMSFVLWSSSWSFYDFVIYFCFLLYLWLHLLSLSIFNFHNFRGSRRLFFLHFSLHIDTKSPGLVNPIVKTCGFRQQIWSLRLILSILFLDVDWLRESKAIRIHKMFQNILFLGHVV